MSPRFGEAGLDDAFARLRATVQPEREVPGWATVDIDRSLAALAPEVVAGSEDLEHSTAGSSDSLLGAFARHFVGEDGTELVLLEPSTEGRLAASLARHGEGPVALYLLTDKEGLVRARAGNFTLTAEAEGPFGPQHLVVVGPRSGPFLLIARPD